MKTTAFVVPSENLAGSTQHRNATKRDVTGAEAFDATLERQKTEADQKIKSGVTETPEQRRIRPKDARAPDERPQTEPRVFPADGRFLRRLRDVAKSEPGEQPTGTLKDAPPEEDTSVSTAAQTAQHETPEADISALTAQLLGLPTPDRSVGSDSQEKTAPIANQPGVKNDGIETAESSAATQVAGMTAEFFGIPASSDGDVSDFRKELKLAPRSHSRDTNAAHIAEMPTNAEDATAAVIANTPVVVREQQTHFSPSPIGRPGFSQRNQSLEQTQESADQQKETTLPLSPAAQGRSVAPRSEIAPVSLQGKSEAGELPDKSSDLPPPAMQVLSKILDADDGNGASSANPTSPVAWHSSERPFGSLLRVIRLELAPASLGVVHITLKGANAGLSVSIEAERSQTAASLGADRAALSSRLHEAGYSIDDLVVTTLDRPPDIAAPLRPDQPPGTSGSQFATGTDDSSRRQAHDGSRRPHPEPDRNPPKETRGATSDNPTVAADPSRAPATAWRGRHATRSV